MRIIFDNEKYEKQIKRIEKSASAILCLPKKSYIELDFVEKDEIQEINKRTRGIDKITDVLSFPNLDITAGEKIKIKDFPFDVDYDTGMLNLGSIVVCVDKILEQAIEYGTGEDREFCYLLAHGICHVVGYDHMEEEDKAKMRQKEEQILKKAKV